MYIIIAGAGAVGGGLAQRMMENKYDVVVIDEDEDICDRLYARIGAVVINGDATQIETLQEAGIEKADVLVALMGDDADNIACGILAKSFNVPKIMVGMRNPAYEDAYKLAGVTSILRIADLLTNEIVMEIEQPEVRKVMNIGGEKGKIFMVVIPKKAKVAGKNVESITKNSKFPSQCVFIAVYRSKKGTISFPRGDQIIDEGDEVFLIAPTDDIEKTADFLTAK